MEFNLFIVFSSLLFKSKGRIMQQKKRISKDSQNKQNQTKKNSEEQ